MILGGPIFTLPAQRLAAGGRTPTPTDWERLSRAWRPLLDQKIQALTQLREQLSACIGGGCLSLKKCALYKPNDAAAKQGSVARYLRGDSASASASAVMASQAGKD